MRAENEVELIVRKRPRLWVADVTLDPRLGAETFHARLDLPAEQRVGVARLVRPDVQDGIGARVGICPAPDVENPSRLGKLVEQLSDLWREHAPSLGSLGRESRPAEPWAPTRKGRRTGATLVSVSVRRVADRTDKTTAEWRELAKIDPLYVIATRPGKEGAWTPEEFYAEGTSDWSDFRYHWLHYCPELGGRCLEIGCGAGRITQALAAEFVGVVAIDVSADMLDLARLVAPANVTLEQVGGAEIPLEDRSVDAVFTCHVLQHLEGLDVVAAYLREIHRVLKPGGTAMVQVGLHSAPMRLAGRLHEELRLRSARRSRSRGERDLTFRVRLYTREEVLTVLEEIGFADIELRVFSVRSTGDQHAFWLVRRLA